MVWTVHLVLQHCEALQLDGRHARPLKLFVAQAAEVQDVLNTDVGCDQALEHLCREPVGCKPLPQFDKALFLGAAVGRLDFTDGALQCMQGWRSSGGDCGRKGR